MTQDLQASPQERSSIKWSRVLLAILSLVILTGLTGLTLRRYFAVDEQRLPNLIGLPSEEAIGILEQLGLEPIVFEEDIDNAIVNAVSSQSPAAGEIVRQGRTVAVGVNRPNVRITIPSMIDITKKNATDMLTNLGLELGEVNYVFSDAEEGRVVAQDPAPGVLASGRTRVSMTLSRGPEPLTLTMPNVKGLTTEEAKERLRALGVRNIETVASEVSFDRPNIITTQVPEAGNRVSSGTYVVLSAPLSAQVISQVPQLVGTPLSQAQMQLQAAGLVLGAVTYITDEAQAPGIVSFAPSSFTLWGTPIELTVNRAGLLEPVTNLSVAPTPIVPTPSVSTVQPSAVTNSSPVVIQPSEEPTVTIPSTTTLPNPPVAQGPLPDTTNDVTTLTEGEDTAPSAASDNSRQIPFNFDPSFLGVASLNEQAYRFKLVTIDERGERTLLERVVNPGEAVSASLTIYGEATLQTYINDILFQAWNP